MLRGAVLYAKDFKKLVAFYSTLGGDISADVDSDFAIFKALETELIILQTPEHVSSQIEIADPPVVRSGTPLKPIISVASMDLALKAVSESGGAILPGASPWKFRDNLVLDIVDPEGNVVQLWQPTSDQPV